MIILKKKERYLPEGISTILVDHKHRVRIVLKPLAHLLTIGSENQTVGNEVLEGGLVEQGCGEHDECVKPSSCLYTN